MALDIGPETIKLYNQGIKDAKTIVWNGPMGVFEKMSLPQEPSKLPKGSKVEAYSLVGGGDSVAAIKRQA